jgi:hypothetical protein
VSKVMTVRAACDDCGEVQITVNDLVARYCHDRSTYSYAFRCPQCGWCTAKDASWRIFDLLASSGVRVEVWGLPAELNEHPVGAPFTHDDLIDFAILLSDDKRVAEALSDA